MTLCGDNSHEARIADLERRFDAADKDRAALRVKVTMFEDFFRALARGGPAPADGPQSMTVTFDGVPMVLSVQAGEQVDLDAIRDTVRQARQPQGWPAQPPPVTGYTGPRPIR